MRTACAGVGLFWVLALTFAGCATRSVVKNPEAITLKAALADLGQGLGELIRAQPSEGEMGLYPAEITVNFDVCASASGDGSLCVAPASTELGKASLTAGAKEEAKRSNSVSVRFVNVLFAPPDSLVQKLSGEQLYAVRSALRGVDPRGVFVGAAGAEKPPHAAPGPDLGPMRYLSGAETTDDPIACVLGLDDAGLRGLGAAMNARAGKEVVVFERGLDPLRAVLPLVKAQGWTRDEIVRIAGHAVTPGAGR